MLCSKTLCIIRSTLVLSTSKQNIDFPVVIVIRWAVTNLTSYAFRALGYRLASCEKFGISNLGLSVLVIYRINN
jgi:hypothetical protein